MNCQGFRELLQTDLATSHLQVVIRCDSVVVPVCANVAKQRNDAGLRAVPRQNGDKPKRRKSKRRQETVVMCIDCETIDV